MKINVIKSTFECIICKVPKVIYLIGTIIHSDRNEDDCLTAMSLQDTNSYEKLHDDSLLSMSSVAGLFH